MLPESEIHLSPDDRGFLYGDGLFETLRVYDGHPFRWRAHLERLARGCEALGFPAAPTEAELSPALSDLLARNRLKDAAVRITVSRGATPGGIDADEPGPLTVLMTAHGLSPRLLDRVREPIDAVTLWMRASGDRPSVTIKSTSFQRSVLARAELKRRGAAEGVFFDQWRMVMEGTISNLFVVQGGRLLTPPAEVCLPGITRAEVLSIAGELGIPAAEAPIPLDSLRDAEELFFTRSLSELVPVARFDGFSVGAGAPGPVFKRLDASFRERTRASA